MAENTIQQTFDQAIRHHQAGRLAEAEQLYRQILGQQPGHSNALHLLGVIALQVGRNDAAVELITRSLMINPNFAEAHNNLGSALKGMGKLDEAIVEHRRAIALKGNSPEAHNNLGTALANKGEFDEAIAALRQAIALRPGYGDAYSNLGNALKDHGQFDEAIAAYRQAAIFNPNLPEAHNNLGNALKEKGELDEAIAAYRRAIALNPNHAGAHSNLVYTLHFHPGYDGQAIVEEHRRWDRQHGEPLRRFIQPHANERSAERRLRIGYVSPDLWMHPVGRFLLPLFENHDHEQFEIYAYSGVRKGDAITARLKKCCDHWHEMAGMADDVLAERIRADGIDILVDLSLHMAQNRLLMFARKPAPVQVSWLGYASGTGLTAMDYRISDAYLDPPGASEGDYVEKTIRIPSYWCYEPLEGSPPVGPGAVTNNGWITFGCFNNFAKVSPATLELWGEVLNAVENSRLVIHAHAGEHRKRVARFFEDHGIDRSRVSFVGFLPSGEYLLQYHQIDIALDTAPYAGGTTTCDALWMGVPTVTLAGNTAVGRGGVSLMSNVGLTELIAPTPAEYVEIAVRLAKDLKRLEAMRLRLREKMQGSSLMDGKRFAQSMEGVYRQMWRTWCEGGL